MKAHRFSGLVVLLAEFGGNAPSKTQRGHEWIGNRPRFMVEVSLCLLCLWGGYAVAETVWSGGDGCHVVELDVLSERAEKAMGNCFQLCAVGVSGSSLADDADYLRRKFREDVTDPATGFHGVRPTTIP